MSQFSLNPNSLTRKEGIKRYKSIVGSLSWFAISLRYDIAHSVTRLQQYSCNPTEGALDAAIRVAGYLAATADFRLGGRRVLGNKLDYFSDSDHAGDPKLTYQSHIGIIFSLNSVPIQWRSKKQPKTVISPAMAEIYACSECVKEATWVQYMLEEFGVAMQWPMSIQVDNKQVISFCRNSCLHSRLRGCVDLREDWVRQLRDQGQVKILKVKGEVNPADLLTKCLARQKFEDLKDCCGVTAVGERKLKKGRVAL